MSTLKLLHSISIALLLQAPAFAANAAGADCKAKASGSAQRSEATALRRFHAKQIALSKSVAERGSTQSASMAAEYLEMAKQFECNWNYGNAIHDGNAVLGLAALERGDRSEAIRHLKAAGQSPGSPQLNSFGPSVALADALARAGALAEVSAYLRDVKRFWKMDEGELDKWLTELEAGRAPDFSSQLWRPL